MISGYPPILIFDIMEFLGIHIMAEYTNCDETLINDVVYIERVMKEGADMAGATIISSSFHHFSPYGVSGVVVIQESHLAIHTWPEHKFASVDIFTCGDTVDPWQAYEYLKDALKAENGSAIKLSRGNNLRAVHNKNYYPPGKIHMPSGKKTKEKLPDNASWITLRDENTAISFKYNGDKLFDSQNAGKRIEILNTPAFGNIFLADANILFTHKDEYIYHEMLIHPVMSKIKRNVKSLFLGSCSGGSLRELLKYENVSDIYIPKNNTVFYKAGKIGFPAFISYFKNPKVKTYDSDFKSFSENLDKNSFELIIAELSFIISEVENLDVSFIANVRRVLNQRGVFICSLGSPQFLMGKAGKVLRFMINLFGKDNIHLYHAGIPSYPSGIGLYALCTNSQDIRIEKSKNPPNYDTYVISGLKYYNRLVHEGSFVIPEFVKDWLYKNNYLKKGEKIGSKVDFL